MIFSDGIAKLGKADTVSVIEISEGTYVVCMSGENTAIKKLTIEDNDYNLSKVKNVVIYTSAVAINDNKYVVKYEDNISIVEIDCGI